MDRFEKKIRQFMKAEASRFSVEEAQPATTLAVDDASVLTAEVIAGIYEHVVAPIVRMREQLGGLNWGEIEWYAIEPRLEPGNAFVVRETDYTPAFIALSSDDATKHRELLDGKRPLREWRPAISYPPLF